MLRHWLTATILAATVLALAGSTAHATTHCQFVLGFATLKALIDEAEGPDKVGECLENQHSNVVNGDALQQTTGGLMVWRKLDNWTAFTDGYMTWINGPNGLEARLNTENFDWEATPLPTPTPVPVPTPAPTPIPDFGDWEISDYTDALTKVTTHRAILEAHTWQGGGQDAPSLWMRCTQSSEDINIEVYVDWETHVGKGTDNRLPISYRLDDQPIVDTEWSSSTDSEATFLRFDNAGRDFYYGVFGPDGYSEVAVKVTYYSADTLTGVWKLQGAVTAYRETLRRCRG